MKGKYLFLMVLLLLISNTIALEYSLNYDNSVKSVVGLGKYSVESCDGMLCNVGLGSKVQIAEYDIDKIEASVINVYAEGNVRLYQDDYKVFDSVKFYDLKGLTNSVRDSVISIWTTETVREPYFETTTQCDEKELENKSIEYVNCRNVQGKELTREYPKSYWKEYKGELLKKGNYRWRLDAKRPVNKPIDFVLVEGISKQELSRYAWFDVSFGKKKRINITYNDPTPSNNYSVYLLVTYETSMQSGFGDLRFIDGATETTELSYWVESNITSTSARVYVKIPTLSTGTYIYMYYGNAGATSQSNFNNAFLYADDFSTNTTLQYNFLQAPQCPTYNWINGTNFEIKNDAGGSDFCHMMPKAEYQRAKNNYTIEINVSRWGNGYAGVGGYAGNFTYGANGTWFMLDNVNYYKLANDWPSIHTIKDVSLGSKWINNVYIIFNATYRANGTVTGNWNGTVINEGTDTQFLVNPVGYYGWHSYTTSPIIYGWVRVKAYTDYPVSTTFGGEEATSTAPTLTLLNPVDNNFTNSVNVSFSCNATSNSPMTNLTLKVPPQSNNYTIFNTSSPMNLTIANYSFIFLEGSYTWTCEGYNYDGLNNSVGYRTFTVDYTAPVVNITNRLDGQIIAFKQYSYNVSINASASDNIGLDKCFFQQGAGLSTNFVTCGQNFSYNVTGKYSSVDNIFGFSANDSTGNIATSVRTLHFNQVNDSLGFQNTQVSGNSHNIYLYVNATNSTLMTANLTYNNTLYTMTEVSNTGTKAVYYATVTAPIVPSDQNVTFYSNYSLGPNKLGTNIYSHRIYKVPDINVTTGVCVDLVYNFTLYDEQNLTMIENTTIEYDIWYGTLTNSTMKNKYGILTLTSLNNFYLCANFTGTDKWYIDSGEFLYYRSDYSKEQYYLLKNSSLVNVTSAINFYDLVSTENTPFIITYKDSSFIPRPDSLIYLNRKYVSLGTYKTVEIVKTDSLGQATGNFETIDTIYQLVVTDLYGNILSIFNDLSVKCQNPLTSECNINLNAQSSSGVILTNQSVDNMYYTMSFDDSSNTVEVEFTNSDGINTVTLNITLATYLNTSVCTDSESAINGVLTCDVSSYTNKTLIANLYKNGKLITSQMFSFSKQATEVFGTDGYLLTFLLVLTLPLMFISSPIAMIFGVIIGIILSTVMLFMNGASNVFSTGSVIAWVVISGIILVWQFTRNRGGDI